MVEWDPNYFQKKDEEKLEEMGYKQQLLRNLTPLHNIGISFSIISAPATVVSMFAYCLARGGPATMVTSWIVVSFFSFCVALSMAEVVSAMPISGGPYFWAAVLAPSKYSAFASWITAWFNILGLAALNTTIAYGLTQLITTAAMVKTDYHPTPAKDIAVCAAILASWSILNTIGRRLLRYILYTSLVINSFGTMAFVVAILAKAPTYRQASFVFGRFLDETSTDGSDGWAIRASPAYVACIGAMMGLTNFVGYDASAHIAEETRRASLIAQIGIITSVALSAICGFALILALLFSMQDLDLVALSPYNQPVMAYLVRVFGKDVALILFTLPMICCWYCGLFLTMSNSRVTWAFSRDRGIPFYFSKINEQSMSPLRAVILCSTLSFALTLPSLGSVTVLSAVASIASIGLLISYGIPIFLKVIYYRNFRSQKGPFDLGFASRPLALVSTLWIVVACVVLCLPTSTPVTSETLNYSPIAAGVTLLWAIGLWLLRGSKQFAGPVVARLIPSDTGQLVGKFHG